MAQSSILNPQINLQWRDRQSLNSPDNNPLIPTVHALAERLWRYHQLGHALEPADIIMVLCSHDVSVADTAARLFLDGWAPRLLFSGGLGAITRHLWQEPEADQFARRAVALGVP